MRIPETIKTYGLILVIIVASFWFASRFIEPPPPNRITMAAGSAQGDYYRYALAYKKELAKDGVTVEIIETAGSFENIELLSSGKADAGFIQSGIVSISGEDNTERTAEDTDETTGMHSDAAVLESLGSLYYEPLWIFSRDANTTDEDIQNLTGKKIAVGSKGSGTKALALELLNINHINDPEHFIEIGGAEAVTDIQSAKVDTAIFVGRAESKNIQTLLKNQSLSLMGFARADGYTDILPYVSKVTLHEGAIDMADNIPNQDVTLLSPVAQLVTHDRFNGAIKTLLVRASAKIHGKPDLFSSKGDFPTLDYADLPIAEEAEHFYKYGPSFLQRILPFWLADMLNRMIIMVIPFLGIMLPLMKIASPTYRWRTRSKIYRWYKNLKKMEDITLDNKDDIKTALSSLDQIDADVKKTQVPLSYTDELYNLRVHIRMIREQLHQALRDHK